MSAILIVEGTFGSDIALGTTLVSPESFFGLLLPVAARSILRFADEMMPLTISFAETLSRFGFSPFRASSSFCFQTFTTIIKIELELNQILSKKYDKDKR